MSKDSFFGATGFSHIEYLSNGAIYTEPVADVRLEWTDGQASINGRFVDDETYFLINSYLNESGLVFDAIPFSQQEAKSGPLRNIEAERTRQASGEGGDP